MKKLGISFLIVGFVFIMFFFIYNAFFDKYDILLSVNDTYFLGGNYDKYHIKDENIAMIDSSYKIIALKEGKTKLTLYGDPNKVYIIKVKNASNDEKITKLNFNNIPNERMVLNIGDTKKIDVLSDNNKAKLTWNSSNSTVVEVDSYGNIKANSTGSAYITVMNGSVSNELLITVVNEQQTNNELLAVTRDVIYIAPNDTYKVKTLVLNSEKQDLTFKTSNPKVATVEDGVIVGKGEGSCVITVSNANLSKNILVYVRNNSQKVDDIIVPETLYVPLNDMAIYHYQIIPNTIGQQNVEISYSEDIIDLDNGIIRGKKIGTGYVRISVYGITKETKIVVMERKLESLRLDDIYLTVGSSLVIRPIYTPIDVSNKNFTLKVADNNLLKVDKDTITALKEGNTTITITGQNGISDQAKVIIEVKKPTNISFAKKDLLLQVGSKYQTTITITPSDASINDIVYKSSNEKIITISKDGLITAMGSGNAIVTATISSLNLETKMNIRVEERYPNTLTSIRKEYSDLIDFQTSEGKDCYPVIDLLYLKDKTVKGQIGQINSLIEKLKNYGFTRVYIVTIPEGMPSIGWGNIKFVPDGYAGQYWDSVYKNTNSNINKAVADAIHRYGMQAIAIYKPYENGGGTSYPALKKTAYSSLANKVSTPTIGGQRGYFSTYLSKHLNYRLKRKYSNDEITNAKLSVNKIEILYYSNPQSLINQTNLTLLNNDIKNKPQVWVSNDNGEYKIINSYHYSYSIINGYSVKDANGFDATIKALGSNKVNCFKLTINLTGSSFKYYAVTFGSNHIFETSNQFLTYPHSMIKLYHDQIEVPSSLAYYVRDVMNQKDTVTNHVWGNENQPINTLNLQGVNNINATGNGTINSMEVMTKNGKADNAQYFYKWGFEFGYRQHLVSVTYGINSPVWGIAVGKDDYLQGTLCEAYTDVRNYWLSQVKKLITTDNYDGIEIRYTTHSNNVSDWAYYGYNEPILTQYGKLYNYNVNTQSKLSQIMVRRIAEIRGDYFMQFVRDAAKIVHDNNKLMIMELFARSYINYNPSDVSTYLLKEGGLGEDRNQFFYWFTSRIIIKDYEAAIKLADEVVIKDLLYYDLNTDEINYVNKMVNVAKKNNKKVYVHFYESQGNLNNLSEAYTFMDHFKKTNADGIMFYEIVSYSQTRLNKLNTLWTSNYFKKYTGYKISGDKITGVIANTTVNQFLTNLNVAGTIYFPDGIRYDQKDIDTAIVENGLRVKLGDKTYTVVVSTR